MSYTFELEFSKVYNKLQEELKENKHVYTKVTKIDTWKKLNSGTKYREVRLIIVYEPRFEHEENNKLELTIWFRPKQNKYYLTLKGLRFSTLYVRTKLFLTKDYSKLMKLLNKYKKRKAIEI